MMLRTSFGWEVSKVFTKLFKENKRQNSLWCQTDEGRNVALEKPQRSKLGRVRDQVQHILNGKKNYTTKFGHYYVTLLFNGGNTNLTLNSPGFAFIARVFKTSNG